MSDFKVLTKQDGETAGSTDGAICITHPCFSYGKKSYVKESG